jgi:hypothetical protein
MRRLTSRGRRENGSIRIIWLSESDKWDSWELASREYRYSH